MERATGDCIKTALVDNLLSISLETVSRCPANSPLIS